jgi:hypothetical protein
LRGLTVDGDGAAAATEETIETDTEKTRVAAGLIGVAARDDLAVAALCGGLLDAHAAVTSLHGLGDGTEGQSEEDESVHVDGWRFDV